MREKRWDLDLPFGEIGECMAKAILLSQKVKVEVKRDEMVSETGNVAIEYECNGEKSGVAGTEAEWFVIVLSGEKYKDEVMVFIRTERLKQIAKTSYVKNVIGGDGNRSKMLFVPVGQLLKPI